jgi:hypothetical protein
MCGGPLLDAVPVAGEVGVHEVAVVMACRLVHMEGRDPEQDVPFCNHPRLVEEPSPERTHSGTDR